MKITLITTWKFAGVRGGTEKVFSFMANAFSEIGNDVFAIYCDKAEGAPAFKLSNNVNIVNAYKKPSFWLSKIAINIRSIRLRKPDRTEARAYLRTRSIIPGISECIAKCSPDVIIAFQPEGAYCAYMAQQTLNGRPIPVVSMCHMRPSVILSIPDFMKEVLAKDNVYIQVLSTGFASETKKIIPSAKVRYIPNAVPQYDGTADRRNSRTIINIGRVEKSKNQKMIVECLAQLGSAYADWRVEIWGSLTADKNYVEEFRAIAKELNVDDRVTLCGETDDVNKILGKAAIFMFPSINEAFPLAMTEAMSAGLPVVGCVECDGVRQLIVDGVNGILCADNAAEYAKALQSLMDDESKRTVIGNAGKEFVRRFSSKNVIDEWLNFINDIVA